ncbi:hypothetical protein JAAARDRAFT_120662 [Jaapia argillacea MUCL 33604]|uniref:Uncharacterized protein n=1 Tax=Jaapia argillacea MUCL 33604 TaxID=933084 RepID=A0A067QAY0_9AGAM|nr:hypothetical protein JAAARDRAFT_120662 [Jaapia argillacea MUCL 33604]
MATLCDDPGQGRVSSKAAQIQKNFTAWKVVNREKRARMKALQEAKKYGRDDEDEGRSRINPKAPDASASQALVVPGTAASTTDDIIPEEQDDQDEGGGEKSAVDGFDYNQAVSTSRFNVQLRIGANGETIIDEDSLFVDRGEEHETEEYTHIEESDTSKFVNSATYSKKVRGSRWSAEETELFYDALSQFGENYELISMVLPGRDRKACKNKFKAEDKRNPTRINYSLTHRVPYDMQTLTRMTGKDFSGPTPVIRAPTPPTLPVPEQVTEVMNTRPKKGRKQSSTPAAGADEEVVGSLEDFEMDEELFGKDSPFEKGLSSTS